jgi:hypothetical protein
MFSISATVNGAKRIVWQRERMVGKSAAGAPLKVSNAWSAAALREFSKRVGRSVIQLIRFFDQKHARRAFKGRKFASRSISRIGATLIKRLRDAQAQRLGARSR